jgi:hypothetical protein
MTDDPHDKDKSTPTETVAQPQQPVEAQHVAEILYAEARLGPEGGQGAFAEVGRIRPAKFIPRTDDVGGPKWGRPSSKARILEKAKQDLQRGDPGMKQHEYAEILSKWLARHHKDEPPAATGTILKYKAFGALWRKFVVKPRRRHRRR